MPTDSITVDQDRLRTVQKRVRELVLTHEPWLRERFQKAFVDYGKLNSRRVDETAALWRRQWKMARAVLLKGYLHDPALKQNRKSMIFDFEGVCPIELATRLQAHIAAGVHAPQLPPEDRAEALFAFDLDMQYQIGRLSDEQRKRMAAESQLQKAAGTHVSIHWQFWLAKPSDWPEDASPHVPELSTLSEEDYFTVALYNLGGLADTDSQRPLIPKPRKGRGGIEYLLRSFAWEARFPVTKWGEIGQESELDVVQFPAHEAEQMLAFVESWIRIEVARRAESLPPGGALVSPVRVDGHGRGVDTADPDSIDRLAERVAAVVIPKVVQEMRAWFERVAGVIESLGARDDGPNPHKQPKPTRRKRRSLWMAEAMLTVRDNPQWSDATIARQVGIDKSRLTRSREYQMAAQMARAPMTPDGFVTIAHGDRSVEAVDDSLDLNRRASRQWPQEEDTDDRIDRETKETQRKPQRGAVKTPVNRRSDEA